MNIYDIITLKILIIVMGVIITFISYQWGGYLAQRGNEKMDFLDYVAIYFILWGATMVVFGVIILLI